MEPDTEDNQAPSDGSHLELELQNDSSPDAETQDKSTATEDSKNGSEPERLDSATNEPKSPNGADHDSEPLYMPEADEFQEPPFGNDYGDGFGDGFGDDFGGPVDLPQRMIPSNLAAERAVLGALLIDPDAMMKIASYIKADDFYRHSHGQIYQAIYSLNERREAIDYVTLVDELERRNTLAEIGGPAYITELIATTPTSLYIDHYARIVERTAILRRLISAAGSIAELAYDDSDDVHSIIDRAEQVIFSVSESSIHRDLTPVGAIMPDVVGRIDDLTKGGGQLMGVPTGFTQLDKLLGGLQQSDLIIAAGRPGMGKSSFGLTMAEYAAKYHGQRVAIFSLEMSKEQVVQRLLSMETGIDSYRLRLGDIHEAEDEWNILMEAANRLSAHAIYIDDTPAATINDIRTKARRLAMENGIDLIMVDYMQLMSGVSSSRSENRQQEISYISRQLKALARELNVPILALAQLSRAVESRADKIPMLSDLRESGSIEQDADVVMFIYREDYYVEETDRQNIADIIVAKHRHGETGTVSLFFQKELTLFHDLALQRSELDY